MDPIVAALVTLLISAVTWMAAQWWLNLSKRLSRYDRLHEEHKERHGLHEVKHATIVATQENLTKTVDEIRGDVKKLVGYANGNSRRGTGK